MFHYAELNDGVIMKKYNFLLTTLLTLSATACSNTSGNDQSNQGLIEYSSRCQFHENLKDLSSTNVVQELFIPTLETPYPTRALNNSITGFVTLEFDISDKGKPTDVKVIETSPEGVFDETAIKFFKLWRYKPIAKTCQFIQINFKI